MRALLPAERLSRRGFLGCGAATIACAPQIAEAQTIGPPLPDTSPEEAERIAAATDASTHMTVPVMIGGKGPFRFIVDTGADRSVIADDVALRLGLIRGNGVTVQGVVRSLDTQFVAVADITLGSGRRLNLSMPVLPRAFLDADGYLGLDAVDGQRVTLDFENNELIIGSPGPRYLVQTQRSNEALVPVRGSMGHLRSLNCRVDGISTTCFLDTGAQVSVGNSQLLNALAAENPGYQILGKLPITGITGGVMVSKVINVNKIHLHSVIFSDCNLAIADMQVFKIWGLADVPALLIGMNFLRQFAKVSIDYGRKEIRFNLASMLLAQRT
jgi:predicted aspartyl protease